MGYYSSGFFRQCSEEIATLTQSTILLSPKPRHCPLDLCLPVIVDKLALQLFYFFVILSFYNATYLCVHNLTTSSGALLECPGLLPMG